MTTEDSIDGSDPLAPVVGALRNSVTPAPGLLARMARRRARRRRAIGGGTLAVVVTALVIWRAAPRETRVHFALVAPHVASVTLVGDFTDWRTDRIPLVRDASGEWEATLRLPPGRYRYAYLVDHDQWRGDVNAPSAPDDFGRPTSIVTVGGD